MNIDLIWVEIILIFLGITFFIVAFFKPQDNNQQFEEKVEKLLEDFIAQIDLENEEMLNRIKLTQSDHPTNIDERLRTIEQKITQLELMRQTELSINLETTQLEQKKEEARTENSISKPAVINYKYEEIINLYQNGDDVDTIAKKMQMGHAEITLVLELSKKGFNYA